MNDEKVFQLLSETNPVPDPDGLDSPLALAQLERRSPNMATDTRSTTEQARTRPARDPNRRSRLVIGVATAALALIVGLGTWAVIGGGGDVALDPDVEVVQSAIEARNRGDIEAYKASLTGGELDFEEAVHVEEALSYANQKTELVGCLVTGQSQTGLSIVECESTTTDDFYGAGGIVGSGTMTFFVNEEGKISGISDETDDIPFVKTEVAIFNNAFWLWLMDAHPAVFDEIAFGPGSRDSIPGLSFPASINFGVDDLHDPAEMGIAVQYVDEFVAQSDVYPLSQ